MTTQPHTPKRRDRIRPDSMPVLLLGILSAVVVFVSSMMLTFSGLTAAAEWASVPEWLRSAVPITFDGAILVYTLALFVFRARRQTGPYRFAWVSLILWTALSVGANALHAWGGLTPDQEHLVGAVIAGLAPIAALLAMHTLAELIVEDHAPAAEVPAPTPAAAPQRARRAASTRSRRTAAVDAHVRRLATEAKTVREIAAETGVSKSTVSRILGEPTPQH
jgi:hypothetical protein